MLSHIKTPAMSWQGISLAQIRKANRHAEVPFSITRGVFPSPYLETCFGGLDLVFSIPLVSSGYKDSPFIGASVTEIRSVLMAVEVVRVALVRPFGAQDPLPRRNPFWNTGFSGSGTSFMSLCSWLLKVKKFLVQFCIQMFWSGNWFRSIYHKSPFLNVGHCNLRPYLYHHLVPQ